MSGLSPVKPNMVNLCKALGMKYDPKSLVILAGALYIAMSLLSACIVKTMGKRKLIIGSLLATSFCSLSISIYASTSLSPEVFSYEPDTFPDKKELLPVVLFMMLVCFTNLGIPWVLLSEVFPFRSRGTAAGASALTYCIVFLTSKTNYNLEAYVHLSGSFGIYAAFGFIGTIYLYFFLPETECKSLVEIEGFYKGDKLIFADDFLINALRKKTSIGTDANKPMLTK